MAPPPDDIFGLVGTTLERKFRVERVVAQGGFGIVYQAIHTGLDRQIALKVLHTPPELNDRARALFIDTFRHEARAIARLNHPSIVQVLDFGAAELPVGGQAPYMALEWLEGGTLHDELRARRGRGGRSTRDALVLLRPLLEALAYAHEEGIAHRDIKPANIMIVPTRRGPVLKLLDFGIAKAMEGNEDAGSGATQTESSLKAFSMAYAAPEQIGGARTGPWTDVHAMALIFTEVLTDHAPYDGRDRTEVVCDVLSPVRPTPAKRRCDVGPWEQVLARALSLRPADRYSTAGELLMALEAVIPPHELPSRTGRFDAIAATPTRPSGSLFGVPTIPPGMYIGPPSTVPPVQGAGYGVPQVGPPAPPPALADAPPTTLRGLETTSNLDRPAAPPRPRRPVGLLIGAPVAVLLGVALGVPVALRLRARAALGTAAPIVVAHAQPPVAPHPTPVVAPVVVPATPPPTSNVLAPTTPSIPPVVRASADDPNSALAARPIVEPSTAPADAPHARSNDPAEHAHGGHGRRASHGHANANAQIDVD